jgi:hypothetical protein
VSAPEEKPKPVDAAPDEPLDQTTPPIDQLQEGLVDDAPSTGPGPRYARSWARKTLNACAVLRGNGKGPREGPPVSEGRTAR